MVEPGQPAPDFAAPAVVGGEGRFLELFRVVDAHDAVVLTFLPADFVGPCTAELTALREAGWQDRSEVAVLVVSPDSLYSHVAYAERAGIPFPILHDSHAHLAESYDLRLEEWEGHHAVPQRASVVVASDWETLAVDVAAAPLSEESPAPVERAAATLASHGIDLPEPTVDYGLVD